MAYNDDLAKKVSEILDEYAESDQRKMFGGIAFMVGGHMCCGVIKDDLVLRLGPEAAEKALRDPHVRPMDLTGRPMKGYVFVAKDGVRTEAKLRSAIRSALDFVETLPPR